MSANGLDESDSEGEWEEILVPEQEQALEITITTRQAQPKKSQSTAADRLLRTNCHKLHTLALLTNGWVRNKWINDKLLQARLLSLTPLSLQTSFAMIHKSRVPDQHKRGRMFETAMNNLVSWWTREFFDVTFEGHLRNRTFEAVAKSMAVMDELPDTETLQEVLDDEGELIKGPKSLMKHTLMQKGSRDTSAQLFTALCRALNIPARLVVSLQSLPWQSGKPKPNYKAKRKAEESGEDVKGKGKAKAKPDSGTFTGEGQRLDGGDVSEKSEKAKGKEKAQPKIKLRNSRPQGNVLGSEASSSTSQLDPVTTPPVFWTEVFSRPDGRWFPVDPVRGTVNQTHAFDPSFTNAYGGPSTAGPTSAYARNSSGAPPPNAKAITKTRMDNRMVYVLAFEEDGYARDVTQRYARQYAAKVAKLQGGSKERRSGRAEWWDLVVEGVRRPYRLHRDDVEDAELNAAQLHEGMPTTMSGFKDHPVYVLVRHLNSTQTIHPPPPQTRELGKFRGEPVYPRSAVVSLKTAENWMRSEGRQIKEGEQPLRWGKMKASTIGRMREMEIMREGLRDRAEAAGIGGLGAKKIGEEEVMQGLYAWSQTELYVPDPIVDGVIPKNNFGNIDLYTPSMLPAGAVHLPFKGITKIAKQLGFDYAEAVTGFEFKSRRATPITKGIVVAAENESAVLEAYWEAQHDAAEKARAKKREQVLKRWQRLVHGLRIRRDLQDEYKDRQPVNTGELGEDVAVLPGLVVGGGGFVEGADDVVQAYQLPRYQHVNLPIHPGLGASSAGPSGAVSESEAAAEQVTYNLETMAVEDVEEDVGMEEAPPAPGSGLKLKSMAELAEETTARLRKEFARHDKGVDDDVEMLPLPAPSISTAAGKAKIKKAQQAKSTRAPSAQNQTRAKGKGAPVARRPSVRKRRRKEDSGSESDLSDDGNENEDEDEPSPAKRVKASHAAAVPTATTGRTLRPRRTKTQAEVEEETQQERAYRRAVRD
ncbi:hypothetical protein R3P38DRAFT_2870999 [Favolaschia claudopus]|uniref:Rad4-domain-containing protein n=1 Tax=Favolaschia claudopus TaxID=2862362 RepID=A0AAW0DBZ1_9AGAR